MTHEPVSDYILSSPEPVCNHPSPGGGLRCILVYPHGSRGHVWEHPTSRTPDALSDEGEVTGG